MLQDDRGNKQSRLQDTNHNEHEYVRIGNSPATQQQWLECDPRVSKMRGIQVLMNVRIGDCGHGVTRRHEVEVTSARRRRRPPL